MKHDNVHVICDKCGKIMRPTGFKQGWGCISDIVYIDVEPCSCVYDIKMKKFNKELDKLI